MSKSDESKLPERRHQILKALNVADGDVDTVARSLGLTKNAVYQHRRKLIDGGFLTKSGRPKAEPKPKVPESNGNGHHTDAEAKIQDLVKNATTIADVRLDEIRNRREDLAKAEARIHDEDDALAVEQKALQARTEKLAHAVAEDD